MGIGPKDLLILHAFTTSTPNYDRVRGRTLDTDSIPRRGFSSAHKEANPLGSFKDLL
jgi:hypothetical protein